MFDELYKIDKDNIQTYMDFVVRLSNHIRLFCKENHYLNEQFYLDWEDALNKISVANPED